MARRCRRPRSPTSASPFPQHRMPFASSCQKESQQPGRTWPHLGCVCRHLCSEANLSEHLSTLEPLLAEVCPPSFRSGCCGTLQTRMQDFGAGWDDHAHCLHTGRALPGSWKASSSRGRCSWGDSGLHEMGDLQWDCTLRVTLRSGTKLCRWHGGGRQTAGRASPRRNDSLFQALDADVALDCLKADDFLNILNRLNPSDKAERNICMQRPLRGVGLKGRRHSHCRCPFRPRPPFSKILQNVLSPKHLVL